MTVPKEEIELRIERFKATCKQAGVKLTHQRIEIFREVAGSTEHPDAEMVYKGVRRRIPTISLDTVYRSLWLLKDFGLIDTLGPHPDRIRFDANMKPHHHFVCRCCGRASDFYSESYDGLEVPESVRDLGEVELAHVELRGLCVHCSKAGKNT